MKPASHFPRPRGGTAVICGLLLLASFLAACQPARTVSPTQAASITETSLQTAVTGTASPTAETTLTQTPAPLPVDFWKNLPIIPETVSARVREIYQRGIALGNNPHVFSRIGDCASAAPAFLVGFDRNYNLGEYTSLQPAIDYFKNSFERPSLAAKGGLNTEGLLSTLWTDEQCLGNETLLACQYRLDNPSIAFISFGTNEAYYVHQDPVSFEHNMRIILDVTISRGIVPILSTKADDFEGDNTINLTIARLAVEYELPLWNFWLAVQPLPNQGMRDPAHLSSVSFLNFTDFSIPHSMEYGMQVRNLTALQMLYFLWEQLVVNPTMNGTATATSTP
jgi:hypothetical protein